MKPTTTYETCPVCGEHVIVRTWNNGIKEFHGLNVNCTYSVEDYDGACNVCGSVRDEHTNPTTNPLVEVVNMAHLKNWLEQKIPMLQQDLYEHLFESTDDDLEFLAKSLSMYQRVYDKMYVDEEFLNEREYKYMYAAVEHEKYSFQYRKELATWYEPLVYKNYQNLVEEIRTGTENLMRLRRWRTLADYVEDYIEEAGDAAEELTFNEVAVLRDFVLYVLSSRQRLVE